MLGTVSSNYWTLLIKNGADDPTRTDDLLITSELLYQLSYVGPGSERFVSMLGRPSPAKWLLSVIRRPTMKLSVRPHKGNP